MAQPYTNLNGLGPVARPNADQKADERPTSANRVSNGTEPFAPTRSIWENSSIPRDNSESRTQSGFSRLRNGAQDFSRGQETTTSNTLNVNSSSFMSNGQSIGNIWGSGFGRNGSSARAVSPAARNGPLYEGSQPLPSTATTNGSRNHSFANMPGTLAELETHFGTMEANGMSTTFGHFPRPSDESTNSRSIFTDNGSMHSPTDARNSIAYSDSFNPLSQVSSRNPSQPPSRHGAPADKAFFPAPAPVDSPFRFTNTNARGHNPSISSISGSRYSPRNSTAYDDLPALTRNISLDNGQFPSHANNGYASLAQNGNGYGNGYARDVSSNDRSPPGLGLYTPESAPSFSNSFAQQLVPNRGAFTPGANDLRHPSNNGTPYAHEGSYSVSSQYGRQEQQLDPRDVDRRLRQVQNGQQNMYQQPALQNALTQFRQPTFNMNNLSPFNPAFAFQHGLPSLQTGLSNLSLHPLAAYAAPSLYNVLDNGPRSPREVSHGSTVQSPLLQDFKASQNKGGGRSYTLRDIQGYVAEFCGDQQGSRFIQNKVEQANSDEKQLIFEEIKPDIVQLMQDVFGNYVIQKFFDHGDQVQKTQIAQAMKGHLIILSTQMYGCRVVQKAIEHILTSQQADLISELQPNVIRCVKDMNGNHVIQKAIERINGKYIQFIFDAFTGRCGELSKHTYGCRVIQRALEWSSPPVKATLLTELHTVHDLIDDQYGNYVVQHMIEHGFPDDKDRVVRNVKKNLMAFAKHKFASNVVEKCFSHGPMELKHEMMMDIINDIDMVSKDSGLMNFLKDQYGNYVLQKMFQSLPDDDYLILFDHMESVIQDAERAKVTSKHIVAVRREMHCRPDLLRSTGRKSLGPYSPSRRSPKHSPNNSISYRGRHSPGNSINHGRNGSLTNTNGPATAGASPSSQRYNAQRPNMNGYGAYGPQRHANGGQN